MMAHPRNSVRSFSTALVVVAVTISSSSLLSTSSAWTVSAFTSPFPTKTPSDSPLRRSLIVQNIQKTCHPRSVKQQPRSIFSTTNTVLTSAQPTHRRLNDIHKSYVLAAAATTALQLSSSDDSNYSSAATGAEPLPKLDQILSKLTSLFPLFVLGSAILGSRAPKTLNWVNNGNSITMMLAGVMLGTGMTLERSDFTTILSSKTQRTSVPIGVLCQFLLMPLSATLIGRTFLLPYHDPQTMAHLGKHLFLGLVLVGCSPGGTASNLVSLIAGADVALSVLLTACSTVLASIVTPLLTKTIVGSAIPVSGKALCLATAKVVLAPVALGVILNEKMPKFCKWVSRWTPFASVILVSLICGGVVANNSAMFMGNAATVAGGGAMSIPMLILLSVIMTHTLGFAAGYLVPKKIFGFSERTARTISIETGMQNSALAVVLAKSIGADPLSYLPGALSATAHSCLGSGLAAFWRVWDSKSKKEE